jgi:hypothetical protein
MGIIRVDDKWYAIPDQGIGNRIDLDLGSVRYLFDARYYLH